MTAQPDPTVPPEARRARRLLWAVVIAVLLFNALIVFLYCRTTDPQPPAPTPNNPIEKGNGAAGTPVGSARSPLDSRRCQKILAPCPWA